jgi:peptidoglycan-associated lipoprotein
VAWFGGCRPIGDGTEAPATPGTLSLTTFLNRGLTNRQLDQAKAGLVHEELFVMLNFERFSRAAGIVAVLSVALLLAACAKNPAGEPGGLGLGVGQGGAAVPGSSQDFVVNVGDRVFFETDSTDLTAQSRATLDKQAQWLNQYSKYAFTVEGHADERGTREYNIALGARRAAIVHDYLVSRGVAANRMRTISYGKERPVATCDDISCWSQNRRAVTVINNTGT